MGRSIRTHSFAGHAQKTQKRNGYVSICHHGEHGDKVQIHKQPIDTEADNSQILSWEPTGLQRTAYEVKWQVYNCTEPGPRLQDWR